jgi:hypothetical protein
MYYREVDRNIGEKYNAILHSAFVKFSTSLMCTTESARHGVNAEYDSRALDVQSYLNLAPQFKAMMYIIAKKNEDMSAITSLTFEQLKVRLGI